MFVKFLVGAILISSYSGCEGQNVATVNVKFLDLVQTIEAPAGTDTRLVRRFTEEIKRIERNSQTLIRDVKVFQETYNLPQAPLTEGAIRRWYWLAKRALKIEAAIMRLYREQSEYRVLTFNQQPFVSFIRVLLHSSRRLLNDILITVQHRI